MKNSNNFFGKVDPNTWSVRHAKSMKVENKPVHKFVAPENVEEFVRIKKLGYFYLIDKKIVEKGKNRGMYKLTFQFDG